MRQIKVALLIALFLFTALLQNAEAATYTIKVYMVRFCDSDGITNCSTANEAGLQSQLDLTNEIFARSNLPFQFVIHPDTEFGNSPLPCMDTSGDGTIDNMDTPCNWDDTAATRCDPSDLTVDTDGDGLINLNDIDVNGDGKDGDENDENIICVPVANHLDTLIGYATAYKNMYPDRFLMFSPGSNKIAKWNGTNWTVSRKGGQGPFGWDFIYMPDNGGSDETLFAHEGGHHLGLPHPFDDGYKPKTIAAAATMIEDYVNTNNIDPFDTAAAIQVFDYDLTVTFDADGDGDDDTLYISDTPPDPGGTLIGLENEDVNGDIDKCGPDGTVDVPVTYNWDINNDGNINSLDTVTYQLSPDRDLVMSYFKDCNNFDMIYSKDEAEVISTALFGHPKRKTLVDNLFQGVVWVGFANNSGDERGTYYHPFNTISEGVNAINAGNRLMIKSGSTIETGIISKALTIEAYGGSVITGAAPP